MRLIDADQLLQKLQKDPLFTLVEQYGISRVIGAAPTIEAEPIRHGHWIYTERGFPLAYGYNRCSVCGCSNALTLDNYCPHCGSKMDEEELA